MIVKLHMGHRHLLTSPSSSSQFMKGMITEDQVHLEIKFIKRNGFAVGFTIFVMLLYARASTYYPFSFLEATCSCGCSLQLDTYVN